MRKRTMCYLCVCLYVCWSLLQLKVMCTGRWGAGADAQRLLVPTPVVSPPPPPAQQPPVAAMSADWWWRERGHHVQAAEGQSQQGWGRNHHQEKSLEEQLHGAIGCGSGGNGGVGGQACGHRVRMVQCMRDRVSGSVSVFLSLPSHTHPSLFISLCVRLIMVVVFVFVYFMLYCHPRTEPLLVKIIRIYKSVLLPTTTAIV